jgi:tetratricopeptide (TPR) repeat protein
LLDIIGFASLIKRKRGEARLTQESLALDVFGDAGRKADISRLENAKVANPQEATIQKLCQALNISHAEMESLRQSRPVASQLDIIPTLSREALQNLAARFNTEGSFDLSDEALRKELTKRADEFRALKAEVDAIPDTMRTLANLKAAAQDAIDRVDLAEVEHLMALVHETELEEAAKSAEIRANTALLRGKVEEAFRYLSAVADSFAAIDPEAPARKRINYMQILYAHGLRYGNSGLTHAATMIRYAIDQLDRERQSNLWAAAQNNLAIALEILGARTQGSEGADVIAQALTAYRNALMVCTRANHPISWATIQNNVGNVLEDQGIRTQGAEGAALLQQAVSAYHSALEVRTRAGHPVDWATTQNNLAGTLVQQGTRTQGAEGADLLAEAVTAYRNALEVYTHADHPVDWAMTQNNLAGALQEQGTRIQGAEGADLLSQAVTAFRAALEVRTRADHPVHWAMTQENIALCEAARAAHDTCPDPRPHLTAALEAVDNALTVFDPVHLSYNHAKATRVRDRIQAAHDALPRV